jgi:hypothetical protein
MMAEGARMRLPMVLSLLPLLLASCQREGPCYNVDAIEAEDHQLRLIVDKGWSWTRLYGPFYLSYSDRARTEYYITDVTQGGEPALSPARLLFVGGEGEEARFVRVKNTSMYLAMIARADKSRMVFSLVGPVDQAQKPPARKLVDFNTDRTAYAVTRSGRHYLLVKDDELVIRDVMTGRDVLRTKDSPLLQLRAQIIDRFGHECGPGTWRISDDLRYVTVLSPRGLVGPRDEDTAPVQGLGIQADMLVHGLAFDRQTGLFHRFDRFPGGGLGPNDAESVGGDLFLLYEGGVLDTSLEIKDLSGAMRYRTEPGMLEGSFVHLAWLPESRKAYVLVIGVLYTWDYQAQGTTSRPVRGISEAIEQGPKHSR